jgi:hypothetical protein
MLNPTRSIKLAVSCAALTMLSALMAAFWADPLAKIIAGCALLVGCATFALVYTINVGLPRRRRKEFEHPGTAYFLVPSRRNHSCDYAIQDDDEHVLKELTLPSNSEITVDFVIDFSTPISYSELSIECQGPVETKPYGIRYFNRFVEDGQEIEISPNTPGSQHYRDKHKVYHAKGDRTFPPTRIAVAFVIKTRDPGTYPVIFGLIGSEVIGTIGNLFITVEDVATVKMRCVDPAHREKECSTSGITRPKTSD